MQGKQDKGQQNSEKIESRKGRTRSIKKKKEDTKHYVKKKKKITEKENKKESWK